MKATLEFNFPEESEEFRLAFNGPHWRDVAWDLDRWLRNQIKHCDREDFQEVRDTLWELAADGDFNL